jgi:hypothetical protein
MRDWLSIERDFRDLDSRAADLRLDYQWHSAPDTTEFWRLTGGLDPIVRKQFEALASRGGVLLGQVPGEYLPPAVGAERDAQARWYKALWHMTGPHDPPMVGAVSNNGVDLGHVYVGHMQRPAGLSAVLAIKVGAIQGAEPKPALEANAGPVAWLEREAAARGRLWSVLAVVLGLIIAALTLVVTL